MRLVFLMLMILMSLSCSNSNSDKAKDLGKIKPKTHILVIAPQGVEPEVDSVGFNQLVKGVTEPFSANLSDQLQSKGFTAFSVVDQNPKYDLGQKIAMHTKDYPATMVMVLTIEMDAENAEKRLLLRIQKADLAISKLTSNERTVKIGDVKEKLYVLSSSAEGDYKGTMSDMAKDYIASLQVK